MRATRAMPPVCSAPIADTLPLLQVLGVPTGLGLQFLRPHAPRAVVGPPISRAAAQLHIRFFSVSRSLFSRCDGPQSADRLRASAAKESQPKPVNLETKHDRIPSLLARHHRSLPAAKEAHTVRGRIRAVRQLSRKLLFLDIIDEFETIQIKLNYATVSAREPTHDHAVDLEAWHAATAALRRGVFISVEGDMGVAPNGVLSLNAWDLPAILSSPSPGFDPPEVLTDDEVTGRRRHLDLLANTRIADTLRLRSTVLSAVRSYLSSDHFVEMQTPILAEHAGGAAARPFSTRSADLGADQPLALRVAPELWLKRLVVGGFDRVFEIGPCFRNEGLDGTHNPEFTMCEFYEAYATLDQLMSRTERLVAKVLQEVDAASSGFGGQLRPWDLAGDLEAIAAKLSPKGEDGQARPLRRCAFIPTLERALGFTLPDLESESAYEDLVAMLCERGLEPKDGPPATTLPKLLDRLGGQYVESESCGGEAVFVTHHPACMAPLARSARCDETDQMVALRAELFVDGVELANMYEEEHDPDSQERKFREQARLLRQQRRSKMRRSLDRDLNGGLGTAETQVGAASSSLLQDSDDVLDEAEAEAEAEASGALLNGSDTSYIEALRAGMPPTGGWGCGIERLVMVLSGAPRIRDVLAFGNLRNVISVSRPEPQRVPEADEATSQGQADSKQAKKEERKKRKEARRAAKLERDYLQTPVGGLDAASQG